MSDEVQLSKRLTWLLRHGAVQERIPISFEGFVPVNSIINHPKFARDFNFKKLQDIVKKDKKQLYTMRQNGCWEIRANKGHTIVNVGSNCFRPDLYYHHFEQMFMQELRAIENSRFVTYNHNNKYNQRNKSMSHSPTKTSHVSANGNKCIVCSQKFSNIQECLKHELSQHDIKRTKRPQSGLRSKVKAILTDIKTDEQQTLQKELLNALHKSEPGQELCCIFKHHRMNDEKLDSEYERIETCLYKELPPLRGLRLHPFGSFASGLALRGSDIDIYIEFEDTTRLRENYNPLAFNRINCCLHRSKCFSEIIPVRQARVPIIKCKHIPTGFSLDINISCPSSVNNTKFVRDLLQFDNRIRELITFLKIWAKQLQLIGRGNMTSYCLITLVLFYLQQPQSNQPAVLPSIKELQDNVPDNLIVGVNYAYQLQEKISPLPRELTTSKLIEGFFKFYRCFEFESFLISPYMGEAIPLDKFKRGEISFPGYIANNKTKQPFQVDCCVCVQDPFALSHNVGKSISQLNLEYFVTCINHACDVFEDVNISTDAQRYEALLYGIIERMAEELI
ncbi:terminal uridylyltransferase Tailor-like [Zeugodacus cucurbitae]|uniref:terminal uridylyltransferase Tailor-like n=1 Tax=Zeugodacus cucurbitae TaxID=28588 RepID=UPI000596985B|nr:terminal uridylyltransferase Tailor-like [Zeugodacus cucurbitae]